MPFPTVKSDPYRTHRWRRRSLSPLWPESVWKRLCELHAPILDIMREANAALPEKFRRARAVFPEATTSGSGSP